MCWKSVAKQRELYSVFLLNSANSLLCRSSWATMSEANRARSAANRAHSAVSKASTSSFENCLFGSSAEVAVLLVGVDMSACKVSKTRVDLLFLDFLPNPNNLPRLSSPWTACSHTSSSFILPALFSLSSEYVFCS